MDIKNSFDVLSDDQLENAVGGLDTGNKINWELFSQTLIDSGAMGVPALAELTNYALTKNWQQLALILPKFLTNSIVMNAYNAACKC